MDPPCERVGELLTNIGAKATIRYVRPVFEQIMNSADRIVVVVAESNATFQMRGTVALTLKVISRGFEIRFARIACAGQDGELLPARRVSQRVEDRRAVPVDAGGDLPIPVPK